MEDVCLNCTTVSRLAFDADRTGHVADWYIAVEDTCKWCGPRLSGLKLGSSTIGAGRLTHISQSCLNLQIEFDE